ncbi:LacI family DNA-binding transcriptional regulator [Rhizobium leguminosarum]|uniref:LacI family DNA-binding transcriptional regulator n=1 Tax=Rhizobium leguminosarum TaxID=384 RepID=UPI00048A90DA|nr:LacI family DNA-binding transcriptional regulator [Rhizobium leguminosarum]MBB4504756.1 LacI family transcriptional regulator [Rhizobium leguminosarum]
MASDQPARRATIHDVAKLAQASTAAVSRVLRDAYGVSDDMAARVKAAMKELDYRPHASARGMRGKTYTIGIVHPDLRNTFFPDIFSAVAEVILPTSRQIMMATSEWTSTEDVFAAMHDRRIEGMIVVAPHISENKLVEAARQAPLVLTHRHSYSTAYDTIVSDDDAGAELVVRHLAELGHKHIVHLGPANGRLATQLSFVTAKRARAYRNAMESLGLGKFAEVADCPHYTFEDGYRAAHEVLTRSRRPTAIFAGTDNVAFGVIQAAYDLGIELPRQLSLVGYDNTGTGGLGPLSLTSVDQNPHEIGTLAAKMLLSRMDGRESVERASITPQLVVRRTTAEPFE